MSKRATSVDSAIPEGEPSTSEIDPKRNKTAHTVTYITPPRVEPMETNEMIDRLGSAFEKFSLTSYVSRLPTFSGNCGAKALRKFIEDFNEVANIAGLSEDRMVRLLPAHLKGAAKAVFENLRDYEKQNWRLAISKLKEHFSTDYYLERSRRKLTQLVSQPGESPFLFSSRIKRELLKKKLTQAKLSPKNETSSKD